MLNPPKQDIWRISKSLNQAIFGQAQELLGFRWDFLFLHYKGLHHELGNSWSSLRSEACPNTIVFGSHKQGLLPSSADSCSRHLRDPPALTGCFMAQTLTSALPSLLLHRDHGSSILLLACHVPGDLANIFERLIP